VTRKQRHKRLSHLFTIEAHYSQARLSEAFVRTAVRHLADRPGTLGAFLSSKRADWLEVTLPLCREHHLNTVKQGAEFRMKTG
jgi:hypothetical protein